MKFRIKHVEGIGYFAQVEIRGKWRTITPQINRYGLWPEDDIDCPQKTTTEAKALCENFKVWQQKVKSKPTYCDVFEL